MLMRGVTSEERVRVHAPVGGLNRRTAQDFGSSPGVHKLRNSLAIRVHNLFQFNLVRIVQD
jgi:hypothetical protein